MLQYIVRYSIRYVTVYSMLQLQIDIDGAMTLSTTMLCLMTLSLERHSNSIMFCRCRHYAKCHNAECHGHQEQSQDNRKEFSEYDNKA
jgi:hypothetical protein